MARTGKKLIILLWVVGGVSIGAYLVGAQTFEQTAAPANRTKLSEIPFNGAQAYEYLKQLCAFGSRPSGSAAMAAQQKFLIDYFQKAGGTVVRQEFRARHPLSGAQVPMMNLLVQWHPDRKERVLLVAHYDTRPFPDRDPQNPQGIFLGANDGASGVAILMEMGKSMPQFKSRYGVDFLLVDGEELVFRDKGEYCLGSDEFAKQYVSNPPPYKYRWGVLLDMVGGVEMHLPQDRNSLEWADTKPLVEDVWGTAARLGVKEFIQHSSGMSILDDHVMLHNVGGIATCDLVDMNYPAWHTQADDPAHCSALSLAKVGWVLEEWLKSLK